MLTIGEKRPAALIEALPHGWEEEDPALLAKAHFSRAISRWRRGLKEIGRMSGVDADVQFFKNPDAGPYNVPTTIALLTCGRVQVPYLVRPHLQYKGETDPVTVGRHLFKRFHELLRGREALEARLDRVHTKVAEMVAKVGHGAALRQFVLQPTMVDEGLPSLRRRQLQITVEVLGSNLRPRLQRFLGSKPQHFTKALKYWVKEQASKAAAVSARQANPGKIEVEEFAVVLMREFGVEPDRVAALDHDRALSGPATMELNGATLLRPQLSLSAGRISARFDFDGGYYAAGRVYLLQDLPETVAQSLIGKKINEVVEGGIFDAINPEIIGLVELNGGTCLRLADTSRWIELTFS